MDVVTSSAYGTLTTSHIPGTVTIPGTVMIIAIVAGDGPAHGPWPRCGGHGGRGHGPDAWAHVTA